MKTAKRVSLLLLLLGFAGCVGERRPNDHAWQRPHLAVDRVVLRDGDDAPQTTLRLLADDRDALKLVGLRSPREELALARSESDSLGMTHVRFRQVTRGIPVLGAELAAHFDAAGRVAAIDANYVPDLDDVDLE